MGTPRRGATAPSRQNAPLYPAKTPVGLSPARLSSPALSLKSKYSITPPRVVAAAPRPAKNAVAGSIPALRLPDATSTATAVPSATVPVASVAHVRTLIRFVSGQGL